MTDQDYRDCDDEMCAVCGSPEVYFEVKKTQWECAACNEREFQQERD